MFVQGVSDLGGEDRERDCGYGADGEEGGDGQLKPLYTLLSTPEFCSPFRGDPSLNLPKSRSNLLKRFWQWRICDVGAGDRVDQITIIDSPSLN